MSFSERYGYVKPAEVLKRAFLDKEGIDCLCTCFDQLDRWLNRYDVESGASHHDESYSRLEEAIWCLFMNRRKNDFYKYHGHEVAATALLLDEEIPWYKKLDLLEFAIQVLRECHKRDGVFKSIVKAFIEMINSTFHRLDYAYRIVDDLVVEITDDQEISEIEEAMKQTSSVNTHLSSALKHLSNRPTADYRNSIKESISAIEAMCREITGENNLSDALKHLEKKGILIPRMLRNAFDKLYGYTNDKTTGIRHALIEDSETPGYDEAKFMLVTCSSFINYIHAKRSL